MESIILECKNTSENSNEWRNTFRQPVKVENGDIIRIKQAMINTKIPDSNIIVLKEDVDITMTLGYYFYLWNSHDNAVLDWIHFTVQGLGAAAGDHYHRPPREFYGNYYIAWKTNGGDPFEWGDDYEVLRNEFKITIPAGQYYPSEITQYINQEASKLELIPHGNNGFFGNDNPFYIHTDSKHNDLRDTYGTGGNMLCFWDLNTYVPLHRDIDRGFVFSSSSVTTTATIKADEKDFFIGTNATNFNFSSKNKFEFKQLHKPIYNTAGGIAARSNVLTNTNHLEASATITEATLHCVYGTDPANPQRIFIIDDIGRNLMNNILAAQTADDTFEITYYGTLGATVVANIEITGYLFADNGFEIKDNNPILPLHFDGEFNKCTLKFTLPNPIPKTVLDGWIQGTDQTGVFLMDLQPRSFWNQLGFNVDDIVTGIPETGTFFGHTGGLGIDPDKFFKAKTTQYMNIEAINAKQSLTPLGEIVGVVNSEADIFTSTGIDDVVPIVADNTYSTDITNSGYYYLEVSNLNGKYFNEEQRLNIMSLISTNYSHESFITMYGESSMSITHKGAPFVIDGLNFRILDKDKNMADVGKDHIILIEVVKAPKNPAPEPSQ
jgi:hypothetical protein